ncbi:MAG: T9SS type A sorting domain-containing protein [Sphingobacteriales bacterium]|nr:T9SS type A sorting domain-containing protein [Sphingobacteriales bacterium]
MNALSSPIWNKTIVNCYGGHGFLTEFTGIGAGNYKEKQELNFGFIAGHFFNFILSNTSLTFYTDIESISTQTSPNNPTAACTAPLTFSTFYPNGLYTDIANCICDDIGTNPGDYKQQFATTTPLTLSPNPTRNNLNLAYNTTTTEDATITLYDLTGKAVLQTTETATEGTNNYNLQLTDLPTGMYIVQLQTATQRLTQKVQVIR